MKQKVLKNIFNILTIIVLIAIVFIIYFIYNSYDDIKSSTNPNRAYVINLNKRSDRWENIQKSFKNSSIELIRLPAIENKQGHIGCGLSFMKAVKYAKKHNMKTLLIFEDDNKPLEGFDERWQIIKNWLDNNLDKWEIFNGGARFPDWQEYEKKTTSSYADTTHLKYLIDNKEYLFEAPFIVSANWIYINSSAYDKVLKWESMINDTPFVPLDQYMTKTEYFKCIFSIPHLALQENGKSDTSMNSQNGYWEFNKVDERLIEIFKNIYNREVN
uniref:Glycosyltransferase n=1 Tax=viral metagenome TaxID=1070528 RepID=A0A6C0IFU7_9ZZZZ